MDHLKYNDKVKKLIEKLEQERERLSAQNGSSTTNHDNCLEYLKTGRKPLNLDTLLYANEEEWELTEAAVNDFEQLCKDYDVTD
jgi:hypothetical protein